MAIHGQGEHAALFEPANHLEILDEFAGIAKERQEAAEAFRQMNEVRADLASLKTSEAEKLQLLDMLRFQINEIGGDQARPAKTSSLTKKNAG